MGHGGNAEGSWSRALQVGAVADPNVVIGLNITPRLAEASLARFSCSRGADCSCRSSLRLECPTHRLAALSNLIESGMTTARS